jgi:hypothetical protein
LKYFDCYDGAVYQALMRRKSPAAVAEAQRLREHLQELRQELDQYTA